MCQETKKTKFLTRYPFVLHCIVFKLVYNVPSYAFLFYLLIYLFISFVFIVIFYGNPLPLPLTLAHKLYFTQVL